MLIGFEIIGSAFYSFLTKPVSSFRLDCNLIFGFSCFSSFPSFAVLSFSRTPLAKLLFSRVLSHKGEQVQCIYN